MKMSDPTQYPQEASWLAAVLYKFLPGGLGAAVMICVDPPQDRRELFVRLFVAFVCSLMLGDVAMAGLHSLSWFAFLDPSKRAHQAGVDFVVGGVGWFMIGAAAMWLKKLKTDPAGAIREGKEALKP